MPDGLNPCRQPEGRLRQFDRFVSDGGTIGKDIKKNVKVSPDRSYAAAIDISPIHVVPTSAAATTTTAESESPPPKKPRAKESSSHFGVRFRPDLQKWVAEIRVFEWKSVDKKVWLGTFDTEVGAACAVDAARKLLKCQKKRAPNFPCAALSAYAESLPSHLQLTNITEEGMFKEVTMFVKRKAQEYAAGLFRGSKGATTTAVTLGEQLVAPQYQIQVDDGKGIFQLTSDVEASHPLFAVPEEDVFPTCSSYGTNESYGSYGTHFPSCESVVMSNHWTSPTMPTSITYSSGPSSCSSEGTSPEDRSWVHVQPSMWTEEALQGWSQEAQIGGDYCLVAPSWEDPMDMPMAMSMGMDDQTTMDVEDMEYLFNMEDMEEEQESCLVGDHDTDPMMDIFLGDKAEAEAQVVYMDNQYGRWTYQESFNSLTYNSLSSSFENREVC